MPLTDLVTLVPCHSLEDFPTYHSGEAAEGLLAAWSALWHPALMAAAGRTPRWQRADDPPTPVEGMLIVIPTVIQYELPDDYLSKAAEAGATVIHGLHRRKEILEQALAAIDVPPANGTNSALESDFLALGLAFMLTELLTRRMRYMSNLDETAFRNRALEGANAAVAGDEESARKAIARCCEALYESRAHYYPVDTYLVDLTLLAQSTLGASLRQELACSLPLNLLATGEAVEQMATREPDSLAMVRERLAAQSLSIVGGEYQETELPFLSLEGILAQLEAGRRAYEEHFGARPTVFGRRRAGLTPALPQILRTFGYKGALHFTLDDGRFPQSDRSKSLWEGANATAIDAIARVPLDASDAGSILSLPEKLGESMDRDFVSMVAFAHWPRLASEFYEDLRRISRYSPVLGKFVTLDEFFTSTEAAGSFSKFDADQYRTPYLAQEVERRQPDPISRFIRLQEEEQRQYVATTLSAWNALLTGRQMKTAIAASLGASPSQTENAGLLLVNPSGIARRAIIDTSQIQPPPGVGGPIIAVDVADRPTQAIAEVPAFGYAWVGLGERLSPPSRPRKAKQVACENMLVNDRCEVTIHPETGGIRSIRDLHARGNRLSQQLALRIRDQSPMPAGLWRDPDEGAIYSRMVAESIAITANSELAGEITSRGQLVDPDGRGVAAFVQVTRLLAASAVVDVEIHLQTGDEPSADPWTSYYCCRFAWSDELADLRRSLHGASFSTDAKRFESPDYVEIVGAKARTAILTGGLPYHRRSGGRMLDSLLVVRGETARHFRLRIALEEPYPYRAALDFMAPSPLVPGMYSAPSGPPSGWLFHIDARHVTATHWSPLVRDDAVVGFRARLLEHGGRGGAVSLRAFRDVASARRVDFNGEPAEELRVEAGRIDLDMSAHEWLQLEARWS